MINWLVVVMKITPSGGILTVLLQSKDYGHRKLLFFLDVSPVFFEVAIFETCHGRLSKISRILPVCAETLAFDKLPVIITFDPEGCSS